MPSEAHEKVVQFLLDNPSPDDAKIPDLRAGFEAALSAMPVPDDVSAKTVDADGVSVDLVSTPAATPERVVLMSHGGGYCMGSAAGYRELAARVARTARARVAVVDYRLAPESPFPAGLEDMLTAYRWLLNDGVPAHNIALTGDSSGAGLALSVLLRARREDLDLPSAVVLFSPWVDLAVGPTQSEATDVGDPMTSREGMRYFAGEYLQGHSPEDPEINGLYADLSGLPPMLLQTGTRDVVHGDALHLAALARAAGVTVEVRTFHGLVHNWMLWPDFPESAEAIAGLAAFVDEHQPTTVLSNEEH